MWGNNKTWINWLQFASIVLMSPFFLFPTLKLAWAVTAILAVILARLIIKDRPFERTPIDWGLGILSIQILATCFVVPDIEFSRPKIAGVVFGLLFYYALIKVLKSERILKSALFGYVGAGLALAIFGLLGMYRTGEPVFSRFLTDPPKHFPIVHWKLPGAEWGFNPNPLGGTLLLIVPVAVLLWYHYRDKSAGCIGGAVVVLTLAVVIFFTQSYGVWIALFIGFWAAVLRARWKRICLLSLALTIVAVIFMKGYKPSDLPKIAENNLIRTKIEGRYAYWEAALKAISRNPLFGVGMNRLRLDPRIGYERAHAHNQLLHTAAELGIPALVAYLTILIGAGWMCLEVYRKSDSEWMKVAARGLGTGQLAFFIFGLGDALPLGSKLGIFFWISLALITSLYHYLVQNRIRKVEGYDPRRHRRAIAHDKSAAIYRFDPNRAR